MMEDLCRELDDQSFVNFKDSSKDFNSNLKNERFYWIRVLRSYNCLLEDFKEIWAKVVKETPAEFVKEIVLLIDSFYKDKIYTDQKVPFSPNYIAACCGNTDFYKHCVDRTSDINPKLHTVSSQDFRSFCFLSFFSSKIVQFIFCEIVTYTSRLLSLDRFFSKLVFILLFL
jgi:hypothetical protein